MNSRCDTEMKIQTSPEFKEQLKAAKEFGITGEIIPIPDSMLGPSDLLKHIDTETLLRILTERLDENGWIIQMTRDIPPQQPDMKLGSDGLHKAALELDEIEQRHLKNMLGLKVPIKFIAELWIYERNTAYPMVYSRNTSNSSLGKYFTYEPYIMTAKGDVALKDGDSIVKDGVFFWAIAGANT